VVRVTSLEVFEFLRNGVLIITLKVTEESISVPSFEALKSGRLAGVLAEATRRIDNKRGFNA